MTISIIFLILGLIIIGGLVAWFVATTRHQRKNAELEKQLSSAEAIVEDRGRQIQQKESEINQLQSKLDAERQARVEAITRLEAAQKSFEEQKALIDSMKTEMTDTFNALSSAALKSSSEDFLRLASEHLSKVVADTKGKLGEHQAAMDGMIKPLYETLKRYEEQIRSI
jgi:DNA recombination protein RmuC